MEHNNNNNTNKTIYKQLSNSVRIKIAELHNKGYKIREIARRVSRDASTISREIKRNGTMNQPSVAAQRAETKPYRYTHKKAQKTRDERFLRPKSQKKFESFIRYSNDALDGFTTFDDIYWNFQKIS